MLQIIFSCHVSLILFLISFKAKKWFHLYMDKLISLSFMVSVSYLESYSPSENFLLIFLWFYFLTFKSFFLLKFILGFFGYLVFSIFLLNYPPFSH